MASLLGGSSLSAKDLPPVEIVVNAPCSPTEKWEMGPLAQFVSLDIQREFSLLLSGHRLPYAAFAEVTGLRETFEHPVAKAFGNYWLGRSLYAAGLYPESAIYFNHLVALPPNREGVSIQMAAMACIQRAHEAAPYVGYSREALTNIPAFYEPWLVSRRDLPILWEMTVHYALNKMKEGKAEAVEEALVMLEGSGPNEQFVRGLWAIRQEEMEVAVLSLKKLLSNANLPPALKSRRNELGYLLASAQYATGKYVDTVEQLERIEKQSNELVQALALLSSSRLMAGDFSKALGTAAVLKSGAFRTTFAPQAYTTVSMALNEFCRYPEALGNLSDFRKEYQSAYRWLKHQLKDGGAKDKPLYPIAIAYLNGSDVSVPDRVASEWIRSPVFIFHQKSINSIFQSEELLARLSDQFRPARRAIEEELKQLRALVLDTQGDSKAKPDLGDLGLINVAIIEQNIALTKIRLDRLEKAREIWKKMLRLRRESIKQDGAKLVLVIEAHLRKMSERMLLQLNRVVDNHELIEAELLSVAGQDIVLQSGNPQAQKPSGKSGAPEDRKLSSGSWQVSDDVGGSEIWQDELGTIEANIPNGCANKEPSL